VPKISLVVVIKGPVANAGSILYLFNNKGTTVPKIPAKKITDINAVLTVMAKEKLSAKKEVEQEKLSLNKQSH